ncbi:MAG: NTP transferase domain-containing protein [Phycisphaerales bacterium]|jgi:UDP-N-acetylglucosamine diphosphorylase/glucosamine-1-phosphate N-acetyltransferase|nr:NTP transferase domain-containing protein [Phycisphaerales bacterium]
MTQPTSHDDPRTTAVILAAGKGTRMGSDLPKVLHEVAGRPMVHWVVDACRAAGVGRIILVIGHRGDLVRASFEGGEDIAFVEQTEQLGTGHAVEVCRDTLSSIGGDAFVLAGDGPLIRTSTLQSMLRTHRGAHAAATLATAVIDDPTGYGRIVRDASGRFDSIVEQKNASPEQAAIREVYPSYACFDVPALLDTLTDLPRDPVGGEYYLTEVPAMMRRSGRCVELLAEVPAEDILSINTPDQLAEVDTVLRGRLQMEAAT